MKEKLIRVIETNFFKAPTARPSGPTDFGLHTSVGLRLKRRSKNFEEYGDHDFGIYLGLYEGKFHVGTCEVMSFTPSKLESFNHLHDLKKEWWLD